MRAMLPRYLGGFSIKVEVLFRMFVISGRTVVVVVVGARFVLVATWVSVVVVVGLAGSTTGVSMILSAPVRTGASGTRVSGAVRLGVDVFVRAVGRVGDDPGPS